MYFPNVHTVNTARMPGVFIYLPVSPVVHIYYHHGMIVHVLFINFTFSTITHLVEMPQV